MKCISKNKKHLNVGCYVYCEADYKDDDLTNFLNNNIGIVSDIFLNNNSYIHYVYIEFETPLPKRFKTIDNKLRFFLKQIKCFSDNKEDVELYLESKKYNL